ncbi:MAG TPA: dihydrofolate reductase [Salinivirgaceae bacterium]|nr:dihydrofolate reductase [Salinivirgaceae bacterium]HQA75781.1 dihydrofolate reductase [Salinivirgaceae bacterium]
MISIIVALDELNGIGINNKLPWHISEDLKNFKRITSGEGKAVLMGRKTWESLPTKPLPNRGNIVFSRDANYVADGAKVVSSLDTFIEHCLSYYWELHVIGGAQIYELFMPLASRLYITRVHSTFVTDTRLDCLNLDNWTLVSEERHSKSEKNPYDFSFLVYDVKKSSYLRKV